MGRSTRILDTVRPWMLRPILAQKKSPRRGLGVCRGHTPLGLFMHRDLTSVGLRLPRLTIPRSKPSRFFTRRTPTQQDAPTKHSPRLAWAMVVAVRIKDHSEASCLIGPTQNAALSLSNRLNCSRSTNAVNVGPFCEIHSSQSCVVNVGLSFNG